MFTKANIFFERFGAALRASQAVRAGLKPKEADLKLLGIPADRL